MPVITTVSDNVAMIDIENEDIWGVWQELRSVPAYDRSYVKLRMCWMIRHPKRHIKI
jgi:hypothetical protein